MIALVEVPIIDALRDYSARQTTRFHMPGHKGGNEAGKEIISLLGRAPFLADVTNIPGMDDLHQPSGIIHEAQKLAAQAFGADRTYFLINGSSCGLMALLMATCKPGEEILLPRNIHRSILSGVILSGAVPVFFRPRYDAELFLPLAVDPDTIRKALERHPDARAVLLVNPTYHGIISNVREIADIVHSYDIPLLVDEAHGPHLGFHEDLPERSLDMGADAVVQGTHKVLSSFTQASMLHLKGYRVNRTKIEQSLKFLQSTSSSYLLLASLDAARAEMTVRGRELMNTALRNAHELRTQIDAIPGVHCIDEQWVQDRGAIGLDLTKVTITVKGLGVTGLWAENYLRQKYDLQVEMADIVNLLVIVSAANNETDMSRLVEGLQEIAALNNPADLLRTYLDRIKEHMCAPETKMICTPREAFFRPCEPVALNAGSGRVAAETVACYPPGIPVLCPGEEITDEIVDFLKLGLELGIHYQGQQDPLLRSLRVLA
ncbi:MAG: aminotransferase class I/II-fold pyridoxal phosphate-dependent enzyme [Acidobacteriota bacterium]